MPQWGPMKKDIEYFEKMAQGKRLSSWNFYKRKSTVTKPRTLSTRIPTGASWSKKPEKCPKNCQIIRKFLEHLFKLSETRFEDGNRLRNNAFSIYAVITGKY